MSKHSEVDNQFWEIAQEEIEAGEQVTVVGTNGHVITCTTLQELWQARADLEGQHD
jgi:membrane-bound ClpP family serine protease